MKLALLPQSYVVIKGPMDDQSNVTIRMKAESWDIFYGYDLRPFNQDIMDTVFELIKFSSGIFLED